METDILNKSVDIISNMTADNCILEKHCRKTIDFRFILTHFLIEESAPPLINFYDGCIHNV